ncbi:hypothetical protein [Rugosimonospora africana]|uniref:Uncharacterized protein n=1 Tax=Rugosimonospora africana TaxID=556532 RepID=A0A8J3R4L0_9ACTN|nr:hypothetical protein [Rugosimonospora africana]GIH19941.1 hypothetical protein Raf01_81130 [Rugosimonospora africana]
MSDLPLLEPVYEDEAQESTRPSHRRRWITVGTVGAVFVAAVATLGVVDWRRHHTGSTLSTPATIGTLRHDTAADAAQTADYLRDALGADLALRSTTGAVYSDPANKDRVVLLFGGTGSISSPDKELGSALGLLDDSSGSITGLHDVPAGPLGGTMRCGTSNGDGGPMTVCGWADNGSLAVALFPDRSMDESTQLIVQVREAVEHRK